MKAYKSRRHMLAAIDRALKAAHWRYDDDRVGGAILLAQLIYQYGTLAHARHLSLTASRGRIATGWGSIEPTRPAFAYYCLT